VKFFKQKTIWWPTWQSWLILLAAAALLMTLFFIHAHQFLAVTQRSEGADILVVEEWMPAVVAQAAAREFASGQYRLLLVSGLREQTDKEDSANRGRKSSMFRRLVSLGVPEDRLMECHAPMTEAHRSAAMAGAVKNIISEKGIAAKGVNVMAPATHARKTWLVHRRALLPGIPVGIVAVLPGNYNPARWWLNSQSAKWVLTNYAGLFHEWVTGF